MARRHRHWYNDMARDTRDIAYLMRIWAPKTPEEAERRRKIFLWILGIVGGLFLLLVLWIFRGYEPPEPAQITATFEARFRSAVNAQVVTVQPAKLTAAASAAVTLTPFPTVTINPALLVRYEETTIDANGNVRTQCLIKGNISSKGAKIYHLPGSSSYNSTKIDISQGERWFCTEAEALAAGWRAAGQ